MRKGYLILLLAVGSMISAFSQTSLNEFIVTKDDNPQVFYKGKGCTPSDGVLVFYTTIPNLKITMPDTPSRLRSVSGFDRETNCYVLCVQPTDKTIGGISKYNISISGNNFKPMPAFSVSNINAAETQYFRINPKESEQARLGRLKREEAERQAALERQRREEAEHRAKLAEQEAAYARLNSGYNEDGKKFCFGIIGGMSVATQTTNSWVYEDKNSASMGYYAGMLFEFKLGKYVSFQPELLFMQKGSKGQAYTSDYYIYTQTGNYIPDVFVQSSVTAHYLEIPFNFIFNIPTGRNGAFFLGAGLYLSCGLSGKMTLNPSKEGISFYLTDEERESDVFDGEEPLFGRFDYGMDFLAGYRYKRFFIRTGYDLGLLNIANGDEADGWAKFTNNCFNLSVGVKF